MTIQEPQFRLRDMFRALKQVIAVVNSLNNVEVVSDAPVIAVWSPTAQSIMIKTGPTYGRLVISEGSVKLVLH